MSDKNDKKDKNSRGGRDKRKGESGETSFPGDEYPYRDRMNRKAYEQTLERLQIELLKAQRWTKEAGARVLIIFEGRDAAGKGGTIKRFTEHMNPRGARVVALSKPNETEAGQWYFQRYIQHLPTAGEFVFFDRSWYNRAGVEPVMGYCTPAQYRDFLRQVPAVERGLVDDGIWLFKLWFQVDRKEQLRRFEQRQTDPLKQWKLSPVDLASLDKWDEYGLARDRMFFMSHTRDAPWTMILSDDKRRARINAIRHVLGKLPYTNKDEEIVATPDPKIVGTPPAADPDADRFSEFANSSR
jgi:polyphosphate kinase 2